MKGKKVLPYIALLILLWYFFHANSTAGNQANRSYLIEWIALAVAFVLTLLGQFILNRPERKRLIFLATCTFVFAVMIFVQLYV